MPPFVFTDQRGMPRPAGVGVTDVRAFEKFGDGDPDFVFIDGFARPGAG